MNEEDQAIREDQARPDYHWNREKPADRKHPQWQAYCRYRSAMINQDLNCPTFKNWL